MEKTKSGFAAMIGRPNTGKSTLMNHLIGQKIAITSDRPQTTRNRIQTVYTDERGQIIFVDTPGFLRKSHNRLGEYMMDVSVGTLADADVVLWLVEPSSYIGEGDREIAEALRKVTTPVILVINKTDTIRKDQVLGIMDSWKDLYPFAEIVPVSGLMEKNLDDLMDKIIREKALLCLKEEVPHGIAVTVEKYTLRPDGVTEIQASVICEKNSHKGIVIGRGGAMLKRIGTLARREIEELAGGQVFLKLFVMVRKDWRDNELLLKNYGYYKKKES